MKRLAVRQLTVSTPDATWVQSVDFDLRPGERLALLGCSGSGKTTIARSLVNLLPQQARRHGKVFLDDQRLDQQTAAQWRATRGARIALVGQETQSAFNPARSLHSQFRETVARCTGASPSRLSIGNLVAALGLPDACLEQRPAELSGGMRQRAMIAMAAACEPLVLIADEATSGLDPVARDRVVALFERQCQANEMGLLMITHDWGLASACCKRGLVLEEGRIVDRIDFGRACVIRSKVGREMAAAAAYLTG